MASEQDKTDLRSLEQDDDELRSTPIDWFLQSLVVVANSGSVELGITLQVSGMLVSGILVTGKQYFESMSAEFSSGLASHPEIAEYFKTHLSSLGEIYTVGAEGEEPPPPPQFIHLKNARFFNTAGGPVPANKGVWWRGRIGEVSGFSLGNLTESDAGA